MHTLIRGLFVTLLVTPLAQAQDAYPNRPVRIVVPTTPGAGSLPFGTYKFAVTRKPGRLSKMTFSMRYVSRSTVRVTRAFSGVFSGIGHSPCETSNCRRTCSARLAHASGVGDGLNGK